MANIDITTHHSMLTAIEAVRHIEHPDQLTKEDIWKVNTEKEYMEEQT